MSAEERLEFKTELKQLLHLITHALYSNKEIFLRELISNASDAINKIKFDSLQHEDKLEGNKDWKIQIIPDATNNTLTIRDNGIGLSRADAVENLGTIAHSGTRVLMERLKSKEVQEKPELIGQFGVGFYSAFMVADKVTVLSRPAGDPKEGVRWESDGQGEYTVDTVEKAERGTDVILHLKEADREFLQEYRLRSIVKKFSDFIEHPVVLEVEREKDGAKKREEETLNSSKAIWLRSKSEVTPEEYAEFYKQISHDTEGPARVLHYNVEGQQEYRVLLFIPAHRPMEFEFGEVKTGPRLYVQRVLIMENCEELLPPWLRFVKGVVDSADLPLNISRELLQNNPLLEKIRKDLIKSVLKALEDLRSEDYEKYLAFYKGLGMILKEGAARDWSNRKKIAELLLFESLNTEADKYITFADYVKAMPEAQKAIYYLIGDSRETLLQSPYLEAFRARKWDVLLLTEPIDEFAIPGFDDVDGKKLQAADRGELETNPDDAAKKTETEEQYKALFSYLKGKLTEVSDVRLSSRLNESAACLVADEHGMTAHMEQLMRRMGRAEEQAEAKRILELNGEHAAVQALRELHARTPEDARIESYARLLLDQAVIGEGSRVRDPQAFARRINEMLVASTRG